MSQLHIDRVKRFTQTICYMKSRKPICTSWKFKIAPEKIADPKRKFIFQPPIFRCYVKLAGCIPVYVQLSSFEAHSPEINEERALCRENRAIKPTKPTTSFRGRETFHRQPRPFGLWIKPNPTSSSTGCDSGEFEKIPGIKKVPNENCRRRGLLA